jgi:hypothetical protein
MEPLSRTHDPAPASRRALFPLGGYLEVLVVREVSEVRQTFKPQTILYARNIMSGMMQEAQESLEKALALPDKERRAGRQFDRKFGRDC